MLFLVDVIQGEDVKRFIARSLADIIPLLTKEPREDFLLRVERLPTAEPVGVGEGKQ